MKAQTLQTKRGRRCLHPKLQDRGGGGWRRACGCPKWPAPTRLSLPRLDPPPGNAPASRPGAPSARRVHVLGIFALLLLVALPRLVAKNDRGRARSEAVVLCPRPCRWMVIMAGMLPGVECARRRRLRQGAAAGDAGGGTRRPSFCLYAAGHGGGHSAGIGGAGNPGKQRSGVMEMMHGWMLDSNAREAKERLDQKLRSKREAVIKRHHSTGSIKLSGAHGRGGDGEGSSTSSSSSAAALGVQREVYSKKGVMRRLMRWSRPRWDAAGQAECAVCLDDFRAGDVLAHLPCGHRFHWACALPWLQGTSRCPFCRAAVDATGNHHHAAAAAS